MPEEQGPKAPLDTIAKNCSPRSDEPTFEQITRYLESVFNAYSLHSHARKIWKGEAGRRLRACHYHRQARSEEDVVEVYRYPALKRAAYDRLQTCASRWSCPLCSPKIQKRRSVEVRKCVDWGRNLENPYRLVMLTLTSRHNGDDYLTDLLELQQQALYQMMRGKRTLRKLIPFDYYVRAREVTYSSLNGWHPHYHWILFSTSEKTVEELSAPIFDFWKDMSINAGLAEPSPAAFDITDCNERVAEYLTKYGREPKWTEAEELTLGMRKQGRFGSLTPWALLKMSEGGQSWAMDRWLEFSEAIKGYHQLETSNHLKKLVGLMEQTDEQLVKQEEDAERTWFANIPGKVWELVRDRYRGHLLQQASTGDRQGFDILLQYLLEEVSSYPTHKNGGIAGGSGAVDTYTKEDWAWEVGAGWFPRTPVPEPEFDWHYLSKQGVKQTEQGA